MVLVSGWWLRLGGYKVERFILMSAYDDANKTFSEEFFTLTWPVVKLDLFSLSVFRFVCL